MTRLSEVAAAMKSANAGASWLTFDIVFPDAATYAHVCRADVLDQALFGRLYAVDPAQVRIYHCDPVLTVKATIPRLTASGGVDETDFDGVQQFAPLLAVEVPG